MSDSEHLPVVSNSPFSEQRDQVERPPWWGRHTTSLEPRRFAYDFSENDDVEIDSEYSHSVPGYEITYDGNEDASIWSTRGVDLKASR